MPFPWNDARSRAFAHRKPWDVGDGGLTATFGCDGRLLGLSGPHPRHGWIHLAGFPAFDEAKRYDADAVRAYRLVLSDPTGAGLVVRVSGMGRPARAWRDARTPEWTWRRPGVRATWRPRVADGAVLLTFTATRTGPQAPPAIRVVFEAELHLTRAAYAQITEGGPLPPPPAAAAARRAGRALVWSGRALAANARLEPTAVDAIGDGGRVRWILDLPLKRGAATHTITLSMRTEPASAPAAKRSPARRRAAAREEQTPSRRGDAWSIARNVAFALDVCAVPVGRGTCIITDPILLPLSWTRDAYYVACLLGRVATAAGARQAEARDVIRRHIRWLFDVCARPGGLWGRSALTGGRTKDPAAQLDQQWYPLLELARAATDWGMPELWRTYRDDALGVVAALNATRKRRTGLYPTSETPADDPLDLPFHFSSHVLAWRTLTHLASLRGGRELEAAAAALRPAIEAAFAGGTWGYAYAVDGRGRTLAYHDANDLPTACAARWGFCPPDYRPWRATLRFAWSRANAGYFAGRFGGLGSVHAPSPWTLGDVQRWIVARDVGDRAAATAAARRLREVAFDDGLLCESYDATTGRPRTRAWFAWPGCAWSALRLGDSL